MAENKQWDGIRDDTTDIDSGFALGNNSRGISLYVTGEIRRRPGLTYLSDHGGTAVGTFSSPVAGNFLVIFKASGELKSVPL